MIDDFIALARLFGATATEGYELLKKECGLPDPYGSWGQREIQRVGQCGAVHYEFHGVGCRISWSDREVDFDFGPDRVIGGFDKWRRINFQDDNSHWLPVNLNESKLADAYDNAKKTGLIWPKFEKTGDWQFYLADDSSQH